ncbi:MAG: hypothetical protein ABI680_06915 [Chthoniobacteraceae bacterium]
MNTSQIQDAIRSRRPFVIRTADGKAFHIPTPDHIAIAPKGTFAQVFDDEDRVNSIPLLTMTSVEYQPVSGT